MLPILARWLRVAEVDVDVDAARLLVRRDDAKEADDAEVGGPPGPAPAPLPLPLPLALAPGLLVKGGGARTVRNDGRGWAGVLLEVNDKDEEQVTVEEP